MKPLDFLETARDLTTSSTRRPRQTNLRRAVSTTYYALFHCLAKCCADMVVGGAGRAGPIGLRQASSTCPVRAMYRGRPATDRQTETRFPPKLQGPPTKVTISSQPKLLRSRVLSCRHNLH